LRLKSRGGLARINSMFMFRWSNFVSGIFLAAAVVGCQKAAVVPAAPTPAATGTNFEYHLARGVVKEIDVFARSAVRFQATWGP